MFIGCPIIVKKNKFFHIYFRSIFPLELYVVFVPALLVLLFVTADDSQNQ